MLNYDEIQRIYRIERNTPTLQAISADFYAQANLLLEGVEEKHRDYLLKLLADIQDRRTNKIVLHAIRAGRASQPTNMIPQEAEFYERMVVLLEDHRRGVLSQEYVVEATPEVVEHEKVKLRMLKPLPQIVGSDAKKYGPFKEDDLAEIPVENANVLLGMGVAERA